MKNVAVASTLAAMFVAFTYLQGRERLRALEEEQRNRLDQMKQRDRFGSSTETKA